MLNAVERIGYVVVTRDYARQDATISTLCEKAKTSQWNAADASDWSAASVRAHFADLPLPRADAWVFGGMDDAHSTRGIRIGPSERAVTTYLKLTGFMAALSRDWLQMTSADVAAAWLPIPGSIEADPSSLRPGRSVCLAVPGRPGPELADRGRPLHGTIVSIMDEQGRALPGGVVAPAGWIERITSGKNGLAVVPADARLAEVISTSCPREEH